MQNRFLLSAASSTLLVALGWLSARADDPAGQKPPERTRTAIKLKLEADLSIEETADGAGVTAATKPETKPAPSQPATGPAPEAAPAPRPANTSPATPQANADPTRHALLIGCTNYPGIAVKNQAGDVLKSYDLRGPANDVPLVEKLLVEQYSFPKTNIVKLVESADDDHKPTREHILREFKALADRADAGHRVVITFSGHGTQQPDLDHDLAKDFEPDGFDEILLPSDVGSYDTASKTVKNALVDDEIGTLLKAITAKKASVCIIIDACQSGSATRGDLATARTVPMDEGGLGIPAAVIRDAENWAAQQAAGARGVDDPTARGSIVDNLTPGAQPQALLAAIYAAQPTEPTIELALPPASEAEGDAERPVHGLLTFVLCRILTTSKSPVTYQDLPKLLYSQYNLWDRKAPTPLVEGGEIGKVFLRDESLARSPYVLKKQGDKLTVNTGSLQGISSGSVFAVYPPPGGAPSQTPLGYVQITRGGTRFIESTVEPVGFPEDKPAVGADVLPDNGECRLVQRSFPELSIGVAVESALPSDQTDAAVTQEMARLSALLKQLAAGKKAPIVTVDKTAESSWVLQVGRGTAHLVRTAALSNSGEASRKPRNYPVPLGDKSAAALERFFTIVGRAESLLQVAGDPDLTGKDLGVSLRVFEKDARGEYIRDSAGKKRLLTLDTTKEMVIHNNDEVELRLTNQGREQFDVSLLLVDGDFKIQPFFPQPNTTTNNAIKPASESADESTLPLKFTYGVDADDQDRIVIFAVKRREGPSVDFSSFAQSSLAEAAEIGGARGVQARNTPLGRLLSQRMYEGGQRSVLQMSDADSISAKVLHLTVRKDKRVSLP